MSAKNNFLNLSAIALLGLCLQAHGQSSIEKIATPFEDPLMTRPNLLSDGAILPGNNIPTPCPVIKDFSLPLALEEAVDLALCSNPQIRASWAEIKVQAASVGEARAAYFPTISGTASRVRDTTSFPGSSFNSSSVISNTTAGTIGWRLFDFGGRAANRESANQLLIAAIENHDAVLQKTLAAVVQAYFDAQSGQATLSAKRQSEQLAQNILDTSRRREKNGASAESDVLQAMTALAKAALERSRAEGAYAKALSVLAYAMGVPAETNIILAVDLAEKSRENSGDLKTWLEKAETLHPAILAAQAKVDAAEAQVKSVRSDGLPTIDFSANIFQNGRQGQTLSPVKSKEVVLGITLTIPLFDGFSRTYKIRGAEAQVEARRAELEDTAHQTLMAVVKAFADANAALNNLDYSQSLLLAAQNSLATTQRKFERGASDILDILNAMGALSDAEQQRVQSLSEWRSSRLQLLTAVGQMGRFEMR